MTMKEIIFVTGNENKCREVQEILGNKFRVTMLNARIPEIQETSVAAVTTRKAIAAFEKIGKPIIVEDTGLFIRAWGENFPGALIKWLLEDRDIGIDGIIRMLSTYTNKEARVITAFAYCDESGPQIFSGALWGKISEEPHGKRDFGFDPIFIPEGHTRTLAEMPNKEKNKISSRKKALEKMLKHFQQEGGGR